MRSLIRRRLHLRSPSFATWRGEITPAPVAVIFARAPLPWWEDERHRVEIPEAEDPPMALPGAHLDLPGHFSLPLASLDPRLTVQSVRRPGDLLDIGPNEVQRAEKASDESDLNVDAMDVTAPGKGERVAPGIRQNPVLSLARFGLTAMDTDGLRVDVSGADGGHACWLISPTKAGLRLHAAIIWISSGDSRKMRPSAPITRRLRHAIRRVFGSRDPCNISKISTFHGFQNAPKMPDEELFSSEASCTQVR